MSEPTKEELIRRITELEKEVRGRKADDLEFKVGEKGGSQRIWTWALPGDALLRTVMSSST